MIDNFGRTCELTRQFGLHVVLEFIPYCRTGKPLIELLDALPPDIPIGVEAPCAAYAHLSVIERGRLCGLATRVFLNSYDDHRALPGSRSI